MFVAYGVCPNPRGIYRFGPTVCGICPVAGMTATPITHDFGKHYTLRLLPDIDISSGRVQSLVSGLS
jgi:hypothetical protein